MFCRNSCFNHKPILLALVLAVSAGKLMAGDAPLAIAAMERDFDSVRALLAERGADVMHWALTIRQHCTGWCGLKRLN